MIELISEKTREHIEKLFIESETCIQIVSPFLSLKTAQMLCELCKDKKDLECIFVTRIYIKDLLDGVNSLEAIQLLIDIGVKVYALQALHAKLYVFDENTVILGSANFTLAGLEKNFELSVLTDELDVVDRANLIVDELIDYCLENNGNVTNEMLEQIKIVYEEADKKRQKDSGFVSLAMYGANRMVKGVSLKNERWKEEDIRIEDIDPVHDLFSETKTKKKDFHHNIWAKFEGRADDRQPGEELPALSKVKIDGKDRYIVNFRTCPKGIQNGDRLYLVSLTKDEDGRATTRIVGRGKAIAYVNKNKVEPEWIKVYPWMSHYRYFCEVTDVELLNMRRQDCIPLNQVYDALGKRTYVSTIDKEEVGNMARSHCRRSHLRMTLDAKEYLDTEIDRLAAVYGFLDKVESRNK